MKVQVVVSGTRVEIGISEGETVRSVCERALYLAGTADASRGVVEWELRDGAGEIFYPAHAHAVPVADLASASLRDGVVYFLSPRAGVGG